MKTAFVTALLTSVAFGSLAQAADLGGDCCADLDERVAELEATTARKGNRKVSLTVSGRVNKAMVFYDFDETTDYEVIDNSNMPTYFGFAGGYQLNPVTTVGFNLQIGAGGHEFDGGLDTNGLYVREASVNIDNDYIGRLTIGKTRQATDRISQIDVSNAKIASTPLTLKPATDERLYDLFDGGRGNLVRYDSPEFGGFIVSGSFGAADTDFNNGDTDGTHYDIALRYAGEFGQFRAAAGIGYRVGAASDFGPEVSGEPTTISGSASVMHMPTGLFLNGTYGRTEVDNLGDVDGWAVKGGVEAKLINQGPTTVFAEYGDVDLDAGVQQASLNAGASYWGAGLVQNLGPVDLYGSIRAYDFDYSVNVEDENVLGGEEDAFVGMLGINVRF